MTTTRGDTFFKKAIAIPTAIAKETLNIAVDLFKILIPAIIVVKILDALGVITILSHLLEPCMGIFGLPGEMAIVWTTAMVTNIYGGIAVLLLFVDSVPLTTAQMTVLSTLILICHSLPVELALTHKVGGSYRFLGLLRFVGASVAGIILNQCYQISGILNTPATILWAEQRDESSLIDWAINQGINLLYILVVLFCLLALMRFLNFIQFTKLLGRLLKPVLLLMGISPKGASIAVFGLLAGITFGSGLLLAEVKKEAVDIRDVVLVLAFLSLCHGIIEDTALMLLLGGHISGILIFRLIFSVIVIAILARIKWVDIEALSSRKKLQPE